MKIDYNTETIIAKCISWIIFIIVVVVVCCADSMM